MTDGKKNVNMCKIFQRNEEAFKNRYGLSLQNMWDGLTQEQQESYLAEKKAGMGSSVVEKYEFKSEDILRVIVGYVDKKQLENMTEGCTSVTRFLLWEPDEAVFVAGCMREDITSYINDERIYIVLGRNEDVLKSVMKMTMYENNILHFRIYAYGRYNEPGNTDAGMFTRVFKNYYRKIFIEMNFKKQYEHLVYENTLYAINSLNSNSTITQLFDEIPIRDIPVIIVAAGPSLIKNCHELKRAKNKAIIIAVTHSMSSLVKKDVNPDIIAVIEPRSHFFSDFNENKEHTLLCCVYGSKEFQKAFAGRVVYFGFGMFEKLFSVKRTVEEIYTNEETGSVATDIVSLFIAGGFKNFILVGQDLAYGEDGMSHSDSEKEIPQNNKDIKFIETEGIYGGTVKTREDWMVFKEYYEKRICEDSTLNIIDATEGGAYIQGTKVMKLSDAIDEYCLNKYPINELLGNLPKGDEKEKEQIDDWFRQLTEMNMRVSANLDRIISLNKEIADKWNKEEEWDAVFSANCKRYDIMYHIIMEGDDGVHMRKYCRADIERYIEDALIYEGDANIELRLKREYDLFVTLKEKLNNMQEYIKTIRG